MYGKHTSVMATGVLLAGLSCGGGDDAGAQGPDDRSPAMQPSTEMPPTTATPTQSPPAPAPAETQTEPGGGLPSEPVGEEPTLPAEAPAVNAPADGLPEPAAPSPTEAGEAPPSPVEPQPSDEAPMDPGEAPAPAPEAPTNDPMMSETWSPSFETLALSSDFVAEGAQVADIDGDGVLDLVAGATWFAGPNFDVAHTVDDAPAVEVTAYALYFLTFTDDINGDGMTDILSIGDAGGGNGTGTPNAWWYENPGPDSVTDPWTRHVLFDGLVSNESPVYADLVGDAGKELVFMTDERLGWAAPGADPTAPWEFVPISGAEFSTPYVHGLGVGDVDMDGAMDVIEASGWWRQLPDDGGWEKTDANFTEGVTFRIAGGAQMYAIDADGDGDGDIVTSLSGHGYGLSWFEQTEGGFAAHGILSPSEEDGNVSQLHAVAAADLNGDGLTDIVTGKRFYAHSSGDPGVEGPALLYWFELVRQDDQTYFEPHLIHEDSGVGCNFTIADVDGNGRPDVFTSSKKGTFLHRQ